MNTYRIDRATDKRTPCGMNSIVYIGDNIREARKSFFNTVAGFDTWNKQNADYGILFSKWNIAKCDYVCVGFKDSLGSLYLEN
jgi:hypothetical protein